MNQISKQKLQMTKKVNQQELHNINLKIQQILVNRLTSTKNYQKLLLILFSMSYFFLTYIKFIPYFIFMNPIFICNGIETNQQKACLILTNCIIQNNFTGTFQNKLFCQRQKYRSIIQSSLAIGVLIGNFTIVPLSNMKGRKFTYIISYFLLIIGLILLYIGIYLNLWYLTSLALIINGISWAGVNILMAIITSQFCHEQTSQKYLLVYYIMWGLAIMSYGLSYYYMPHWHQHFIYLLLLPTLILFFISKIFLIQTPQYWLFIAHDVNNFNKQVQNLTIYNGINENIQEQLNILVDQFINLEKQSQKNQNKWHSLNLFTSNRKTIINCICFTLLFLAIDFYYYSMQGTMQRTGYNFGVSMLIAGIHETVGFIIMILIINKINKKVGLLAFTILATLCGLSFLLNKVKTDNFLQSIAISISSFSSVFIFALLAIMELQAFTTETRAIAMGIANGLGDIIVILQPYVVNFVNSFQFHPIIVCSCFYFALGILPIYFINNKNVVNQKKNQYDDQYFNQQSA